MQAHRWRRKTTGYYIWYGTQYSAMIWPEEWLGGIVHWRHTTAADCQCGCFYDSMHPIGYHFSSSPTYAPLIAHLVKEAISKLQQTGTKASVLDKEPTMVLEWVDASRRIQCILVRVTRSVTLQYPNAYFLFVFFLELCHHADRQHRFICKKSIKKTTIIVYYKKVQLCRQYWILLQTILNMSTSERKCAERKKYGQRLGFKQGSTPSLRRHALLITSAHQILKDQTGHCKTLMCTLSIKFLN